MRDGEGVDMARSLRVDAHGLVPMDGARVRDVNRLEFRAEAQSIRPREAIGNCSDIARRRLEAVDLARQHGVWADVLVEAVGRVREPDGAVVGVDDDVVDAVELSAVEGGDEGLGRVGGRGVGDVG